jgi:hypothetical protein
MKSWTCAEHVQFHALHRVDLALERGKRIEVPRDIDHDAAPHEALSVIDHTIAGMATPPGTLVIDCRSVAKPRRTPAAPSAVNATPSSLTIGE